MFSVLQNKDLAIHSARQILQSKAFDQHSVPTGFEPDVLKKHLDIIANSVLIGVLCGNIALNSNERSTFADITMQSKEWS